MSKCSYSFGSQRFTKATFLDKLFCSGINILDLIENLQALFFEKEEGKLFFPLSRSFVTTLADEQIENLHLLLNAGRCFLNWQI